MVALFLLITLIPFRHQLQQQQQQQQQQQSQQQQQQIVVRLLQPVFKHDGHIWQFSSLSHFCPFD